MITAATRHLALAATTLALVAACDPELDEFTPDGDITFRCNPLENTCGPLSNTPFIGALEISALDTLGNVYKDVAVDDLVLPGNIVLDEFWAAGGQLHGLKGALEYQGMDFLGAEFKLTVEGQPLSLHVSAVTPPPAGESFWLYRFDAGDEAEPVCDFTGAEVRAVVHDDLDIDPQTGEVSARPDTVYIACLGGAAGKVAYAPLGFGFRPLEVGLAAFEAAMRFIRADYCGDGTTWTENGQPISYEDKWGVGAGVELGHTDAVWGMHGALCLGEELRAGFTYDDIECPSGPKPPRCKEVAAEALYLARGKIWSALP